jgi:hypothetical protein
MLTVIQFRRLCLTVSYQWNVSVKLDIVILYVMYGSNTEDSAANGRI